MRGVALAGDGDHPLHAVVDLGHGPVEFDDEERFGVERIAGVRKGLGRLDRELVHHLHAGRDDAFRDHPADARGPGADRGEAEQRRPGALGLRPDLHRDLGNDAEQALRARDHAEQVVARGVRVPAADPQHVARHRDQLDPGDVVRCHPVLEAVDAPRVLGHVAADRARDLARRIGRVVETLVLYRPRDRQVGDPGLRHHAEVVVVDLENAVEAAQAQGDPVPERQGAARQPGAGPARNDLHAAAVAELEHGGDLLGRFRQHHQHRQLPVGRQTVGFIGEELAFLLDDAFAGHDRAERRHEIRAGRDDRGIRLRHPHAETSGRDPPAGRLRGRLDHPWRAFRRGFFLLIT